MNRRTLYFTLILTLVAVAGGLAWWLWPSPTAAVSGTVTTGLSEEDLSRYSFATEPDALVFPRDFGPHNDFLTEWWYYTGNLTAEDGREFGYQFTIFRRALTPDFQHDDGSSWRTNQVYLAHFTVSDISNERFFKFEKLSRGGADLAGASAVPYHVWLEDWYVRENDDGSISMLAQGDGVILNLNLVQEQPPVIHGDGGLSPKGPDPGNASYYYSLVNQTTTGTITLEGETIQVEGRSWKDHEYSTSALNDEAIGWDWFSMQFDNPEQNALVLWEIRQEDGTIALQSAGSWINADSSTYPLQYGDFQTEVLETWTSPHTGAEYPIRWRITIPDLDLELIAEAMMADQELQTTPVYWEGAVKYEGTLNGRPISGKGYVEMTGYDQPMQVRF